jgi:ADP-heptose:LPS heptosyltransferase
MGKKIDLTNGKKINIAIACASAQKYTFNHTRNISLKFFLPLIDYSNLFLVQNTVDKEDELFLQQNPEIIFFGKDKNFTDIAILIENVDLVISIDTVFVHLAGALGKKTFLLLGDYSDWRWLLNIKNSIWYSSLTIFRKKMQDNDFKNLFREINKILIIMKKS